MTFEELLGERLRELTQVRVTWAEPSKYLTHGRCRWGRRRRCVRWDGHAGEHRPTRGLRAVSYSAAALTSKR